MTKTATIPFSGFYDSLHDSQFDDELERMFTDREDDTPYAWTDALQMKYWNACNWHAAQTEYAKAYAEKFCEEFKIAGATFDEMVSPREYNFSTDRVFIKLPIESVREILARVTADDLAKTAKANHTSRDGFFSFYSNDFESWGDVAEWDHNQIGTLIQALADSNARHGEKSFDSWQEYNLCDDFSGNGDISGWMDDATPMARRLWSIHEYLVKRSEREQPPTVAEKLEYLRMQIRAECISYEEIAELQSLAESIPADDVELLEWAGVPEA